MDAEGKVFMAFYNANKRRLYFNEIKEFTHLSNSSLQNVLQKLMEKHMLEKEETKANVFYSLSNNRMFALEFAKIDITRFEELHRNVRIPLTDFLLKIPKEIVTVILFGSCARKEEKTESDIDLLVVMHSFHASLQKQYEKDITNQFEAAKKEIQTRSLHSINLSFTTIESVKAGTDHLVSQAKETGFPICNQQLYYEVMHET
jgi:predicted nucleotidyltransferase